MAQAYSCRSCGTLVTVGVPTVTLTRQVSEVLSKEFERIVVYHDWSPSSTDAPLRERAEQIWQQKCEDYFTATGNLRAVPEQCPKCEAVHSWSIALGAE